ncbi:MAG: MobC family plasmid mobilization relaxosome protein [Clostridia bacterium]|nr:MobC family plasmid mobilization relaxosome protein [Clostridia bacterium]
MARKRNERFNIRLTSYEKAFITCKMRESGFDNLADYFLHCASNNRTVVVNMAPVLSVKTELNKIGTNINQIAKKANTSGFLNKADIEILMSDMQAMKDTVNSGFDALKKEGETIGVCENSSHKAEHAP